MKVKSGQRRLAGLIVAVVILTVLNAGMLWFLSSHRFIDGKPYAVNSAVLDLRERKLSVTEYEELCRTFPDKQILWCVPFQDGRVAEDTRELSVTTLSEEDLEMLAYFPELTQVDATGCRDYDRLLALRNRYPHLQVSYCVPIDGQEYSVDTTSLTVTALTDEDIAMAEHLWELKTVDASACRSYEALSALRQLHPGLEITYKVEVLGQTLTHQDTEADFARPELDRLITELAYAVNLEKVHIDEPAGEAESLKLLLETYPDIDFTWTKTIFGQSRSSEETEFDFSGMDLGGTAQVEQAMAWFPGAEKVIMSNCGIDNETMSAFREKMRSDYKVVWTVYVTKKPVRTDATVIHSSGMEVCLIDEQSYDLMYCEDAVVVDIGHSYVKYVEWVRYMPNLKYLILSHNWIKDLTPISTCKNLVYLELFWNEHIPDYSPLVECTALKDLNISGSYADPAPLMEMTWLETLWAGDTDFTAAERQALTAALPNTRVEYNYGYTGGGWRQVQGYYDMRDLMGLPYNAW